MPFNLRFHDIVPESFKNVAGKLGSIIKTWNMEKEDVLADWGRNTVLPATRENLLFMLTDNSTGRLAESLAAEVERDTDGFSMYIIEDVERDYGLPFRVGTSPGYWPNLDRIVGWSSVSGIPIVNDQGDEISPRNRGYLVSRQIYLHGTQPHEYGEKTFDELVSSGEMERIQRRIGDRLTMRMKDIFIVEGD